jgi:hypothetical protein
MLTTVRPATSRAKPSVPRARTASSAAASAIMSSTGAAAANTAATSAATVAPAARSGSARSGVRFHTTSGRPARARLSAMGWPMTPSPTKPTGTLRRYRCGVSAPARLAQNGSSGQRVSRA